MRGWVGLLVASTLVFAGACESEDPAACVPETDLAFCARLGFACGEATGFDDCEASRTVVCGMCAAGESCVANACVASMDGGALDAGDGGDAGAGDGGDVEDAGAPDAGSCLASNGWPVSTLPAGYEGSGYALGDDFPPFEDMIDQSGASDVFLGQFHGAMVVLAAHAIWSVPSVLMDETAQVRLDALNEELSDVVTVQISVLVDDDTPGATAEGGFAMRSDAFLWAADASASFPVLAGPSAYQLSVDAEVGSLPTVWLLDPMLEVRRVFLGYPGDEPLRQAVRDAWSAFREANPGWTSTFCEE
mgnify:CR=1 FL=1